MTSRAVANASMLLALWSGGTACVTTPLRDATPGITITAQIAHGRLEDHGGLRVLRLWGTAPERGHAHGKLLGSEVIDLLRRELLARFGDQTQLLARARELLPVLVAFPADDAAELSAVFDAAAAGGADLALPGFGRDLDRHDLLLVNAMDLVVQMGCTGFTVSGDQVVGGGVLTARNFDWPVTGPHLLNSCCLIVQHPADGAAFATVAWPGYLGAVTGINRHGVAVFLHYGDRGGGLPRPQSHPTATAARCILRRADARSAFAVAREELAKTCPPRGYLTHVVVPQAADGRPTRVFESDRTGTTSRPADDLCVVTNHFLSRPDAAPRGDSLARWTRIGDQLQRELDTADRRLSIDEAWAALAAVERGGRRFGTLHSVVFRQDPWVCEFRLGIHDAAHGVGAAPSRGRRFRLSMAALFADPHPADAIAGAR